ncbi:MAG: DedA family protein [Candidatus Omnitrophica bacterium]|nr:DedA family protein [Candidatus Omnitrophota bacterium]
MDMIMNVVEFFFHIDKYLNVVIQNCGVWSYAILFAIIFAETGLVVTPFLPGDSLLFAVGALAAAGSLDATWVFVILAAAAIMGDSANYAIGKFFGEALIEKTNSRFLKKKHIDRTHKFFEKYGGKTIVLARFVPIVRTFAPFVAGIGEMSYLYFFTYNVVGGILWVAAFVFGGFFFGGLPFVKENFSFVILAIVLISILPGVIEILKHKNKKQQNILQG